MVLTPLSDNKTSDMYNYCENQKKSSKINRNIYDVSDDCMKQAVIHLD